MKCTGPWPPCVKLCVLIVVLVIDQFLLNRDTNNTPVERLGRVHEHIKNQEKSGA